LYKISRSKNERAVVSIGGCSRSGKTVLAGMLRRDLEQRGVAVRILKLDNWLKGVDERTGKETVRERYDYAAITRAVNDLREGKQVCSPSYDARTRRIVKQADATPISIDTGVIIVDGTISLDIPELRELSNFKVFVEIDDILRKQRLVSFYREYKKCSEEETNRIIAEREKEEIPIIKDTREFADFVLRFEG
jgi:uridine kinase